MNKKEVYEMLCYNTDNSGIFGEASEVIFPKKVSEVQDVIKNHQNIVPRGFGGSVVGGCVPSNSVVVDMKGMNKMYFDYNSKSVKVEAGVSINELNERLKSIGYELPVFGEGTIGGMIAVNSPSFMGAYGNIKNWIDEVELVNGRGDVVIFNKAGLGEICGMEGTTGIIANAHLSVIPFVHKSISVFQSSSFDEVFAIARRLRLEKSVVMLRIYSPFFSKSLGFPYQYHLFVGFNGDQGKIKGIEYDKLFNLLRKDYYSLYRLGYKDSEDPQFIFDKVREFVLYLNKLSIPYSGDLHLGIIFSYFNEEIKKQEVIKMIQRMNAKLGKYGVGIRKKDRIDDIHKKILKRIKLRHDPFLKLNKGKLIDVYDSDTDHKDVFSGVDSLIEVTEKESSRIVVRAAAEINKNGIIDEAKIVKSDKDSSDDFSAKPIKQTAIDKNLLDKIMFNKGSSEEEIKDDKK